MNQPDSDVPDVSVIATPTRILLVALIAFPLLLQVGEVFTRGVDPDEFEHFHVAYSVHQGEVPYRDFFEHHGPLLAIVAQPTFFGAGAEVGTLWILRAQMLGVSFWILRLTSILARRVGGERAGLIAPAFLAWSTIFHAKGIEFRPDVPAALLLSLAAREIVFGQGVADEKPSWRSIGRLGLTVGLATLFTQKCIVPAVGLMMGLVVTCDAHRYRSTAIRISAMVVGVVGVWASAWLGFWMCGAHDQFIHSTVVRLWTWSVQSNRWENLRPTLVADFSLWFAALCGFIVYAQRYVGASASRVTQAPAPDRGASLAMLAVATVVCVASLAWVKASYSQYYFLWFPWLSIIAACGVCRFLALLRTATPFHVTCVSLAAVVLTLVQVLLGWRALIAGPEGSLSHLPRSQGLTWALLAGTGVLLGVYLLAIRQRRWNWCVGSLVVIGGWHGHLRNLDVFCWSNRSQVEAINQLHEMVPPGEAVLDGFTGYGCLRRHYFYYWWLNEYSIPLVPPSEFEVLSRNLELRPPRVILFDDELRRLPRKIVEHIESTYVATETPPLYILPREWRDESAHKMRP